MNIDVLDLSVLSLLLKIVLIIIVFVIIVQALRIMSKDIKRGNLKNGKNLGWNLIVKNSGDSNVLNIGDIIAIGDKISIGRNPANQLVLASQSVSSYHAQIYFEHGRYMLEDLNSTNGTFMNGIRIDRKSLQPGDEIRISQTLLKVSDD